MTETQQAFETSEKLQPEWARCNLIFDILSFKVENIFDEKGDGVRHPIVHCRESLYK
jgi:DNA-binding XRE family transcriptional regulator